MRNRPQPWLAVALLVVLGRPVAARPALSELAIDPFGISLTDEETPVQQSHAVATLEVITLPIALNVASQLYGADWAKIDLGTMRRNLTNPPVFDEDPFTTDQLAHPWTGAMLFSAARSTGHGFWVSGLYTAGGSLFWELLLENEPPSINDQITTTMGGMLIGEALHRFGRALLYTGPLGEQRPNLVRRAAATAIDPIAAANRFAWGDAWAGSVPPNLYAHLGIGAQSTGLLGGDEREDAQLYLQFVAEHGLVGDEGFRPRRPLDHFELRGSFAASRGDLDGTLYVRGLAVGTGFGTGCSAIRGVAGLFGSYDFSNEESIRHSELGFGPGGTTELQLDGGGYLQGTIIGYVVPWGAAGGETEEMGPRRDYHHGPGLAALAELKLGRARLGELRVTSRLYRIQGTFAKDPANETIAKTTFAGRLQLARHHALGLEGDHGYRRASFADAGMELVQRTTEVRAFYAITTDGLFGGSR